MLATLTLAAGVAAAPIIPLPDAATAIISVQAGGIQVYRCTSRADAAPTWTLDHPVATLYNEDGTVFGAHGAGPSWTASDGSTISADGTTPLTKIAKPNAVSWLALRVTAHSGTGVLADARYVERYDTLGGTSPDPAGCTAAAKGSLRAVHYSAVYEFFR